MDKCKVCKNTFKRKYPRGGKRKIYCSKKCRYSDSFITKTCPTCNKEFKKNFVTKNAEYCSLSCIQRHPCQLCGKIITGRKTFQSGEKRFCSRQCSNFVHRTINSKKAYGAKGYANSLKKYNEIRCNKCGINDIRVLVVHHINSDRNDNSYSNLETLCANCHHILHWGETDNRLKLFDLAHLLFKFDINI